jgi:hypothetical protein
MLCIVEVYDGILESVDIYYDDDECIAAWEQRLTRDRFGDSLSEEEINDPYWDNGYGQLAGAEDEYASDGKVELRRIDGTYHYPEITL